MHPTADSDSSSGLDPVRSAASRRPDGPALIAGDTVLTWAELDALVDRAARRLVSATPTEADSAVPPRVALVLPNGLDFAVSYFAVLRAGLVAVPLNPDHAPDEIHYALRDCGAALVVAEPGIDVRVPVIAPLYSVPGEDLDLDLPVADPDVPAVLLYTSGTGGRPKAAMLSRAALAANHDQLSRIDPPLIGPDDVVLLALPLSHAYGLNTGLGSVAHHGACGVLMESFDPARSLALLARHRITVTIGVPSMYAAWSRIGEAGGAFESVRTCVCGAAPLDPGDARRFTEVTGNNPIIGYGLTEAAPVLTTTAVGHVGKVGSIGRPLPGVELLLRAGDGRRLWHDGVPTGSDDPDELNLTLPDSPGAEPGEIVVRGANLFAGYWPDGRDGPDAQGWWGTGDIAYADAGGDLVLVDRIGELILVNGFNVYPAEIERVLDGHPGVAEVAVVGVPSARTGQTPRAYVVPVGDPAPTEAELARHCAGLLARFKVPSSIELVAELPHSAVGKVRKTQLRSEHSS